MFGGLSELVANESSSMSELSPNTLASHGVEQDPLSEPIDLSFLKNGEGRVSVLDLSMSLGDNMNDGGLNDAHSAWDDDKVLPVGKYIVIYDASGNSATIPEKQFAAQLPKALECMKGDEIQTMIVEVTEEGDLIQVEDCSLQLEDLSAIQCTDLPLAEEVGIEGESPITGELAVDLSSDKQEKQLTGRKSRRTRLPNVKSVSNGAVNQNWSIPSKDSSDDEESPKGKEQYKQGMWSKEESDILQENIERYCQEQGIDHPRKIVFNMTRDERKGFYRIIARGIQRPLFSIYRRVVRMYEKQEKVGPYSQEEVEALKQLVSIHGKNWKLIGAALGRSGESIKDRYRLVRDDCRNGKWNEEEEQKLSDAVHQVCGQESGEMAVSGINWTEVAQIVGTRSEKQCRNKWLHCLYWKESKGSVWTHKDDLILVEKIGALNAKEEGDIDWTSLVLENWSAVRSPQWLRNKWGQLKRTYVINHKDLPLEEVFKKLRENISARNPVKQQRAKSEKPDSSSGRRQLEKENSPNAANESVLQPLPPMSTLPPFGTPVFSAAPPQHNTILHASQTSIISIPHGATLVGGTGGPGAPIQVLGPSPSYVITTPIIATIPQPIILQPVVSTSESDVGQTALVVPPMDADSGSITHPPPVCLQGDMEESPSISFRPSHEHLDLKESIPDEDMDPHIPHPDVILREVLESESDEMMLLRRTGVSRRVLQWCDAKGKLKVKARMTERTMPQKRDLCTPAQYPVQKFDYLLLLDFEATCDNIKTPYPQEIIEFPCLKVNAKNMEVESTFHQYVLPRANPCLTSFCTNLTGIIQEMVNSQPHLEETMELFDKWMEGENLKDPKVTSLFVTCGDWDLKVMLPSQCQYFRISIPDYFTRWSNLKKAFCSMEGMWPKGLLHMMTHLNIPHQGRLHSGIDDCKNMATVVKALAEKGCVFEETHHQVDERPPR
ncbi:unnamed protein product [Darwinula stevensoni]|uniref:Uncharacterized protein n=1 Tax=Darwinula stevensoni TaxID=69355 RepID=A0A7R9ADU9_9CRUS|nr:unnamed protein product [Darwinula stevensoni]CAG0901420.1 unnamed protein product [Darwinula stevensoni]